MAMSSLHFTARTLILFVVFTALAALAVFGQGSSARYVPTEQEKTDLRVTNVMDKAEAHFKNGKLELENNRLEPARVQFDRAVDVILDSGLDIRMHPRLWDYYVQLVERIYRLEVPYQQGIPPSRPAGPQRSVRKTTPKRKETKNEQVSPPQIGFREQKFEPSPQDALWSKNNPASEENAVTPAKTAKSKTRAVKPISTDARPQQRTSGQDEMLTMVPVGQSIYGIRYDINGVVTVNNDVVMGCAPVPQDSYGSKLAVSRPSPLKKLVLVRCDGYDDGETDIAYLIDTARHQIASRDIVPKHWQIKNWISWSPDERFALVAAAGEVTNGDMAFVDLQTNKVEEIYFKDFTNNPQIKQSIMDEIQDFDPTGVAWINAQAFRLRLDVHCNPYELGDEQCDGNKVLRSYPAQINLRPFNINYGINEARSPITKLKEPARGEQEGNVSPQDVEDIELSKSAIGFNFESHPLIQQFINLYQGRDRSAMESALRRSGKFTKMARQIFREEGVPEDIVWLGQVESNWNVRYSNQGREGLWQVPVDTGKLYGLRQTAWIDERNSFEKATRASARYLKDLAKHFNGDWNLAMAAYNTGQDSVDRAISRAGSANFWKIYPYIAQETKNYVPNILATILIAKNPEKYGFRGIQREPPMAYDIVQVPNATSLQLIAQATGTTLAYIRSLNPELQQATTPRGEAYQVRIHNGKAKDLIAVLNRIPGNARESVEVVSAIPGEDMEAVSRRTGISIAQLQQLNGGANAPLSSKIIVPKGSNAQTVNLVPPKPVSETDTSGLTKYRARSGDTIAKIAERFNFSADAVARVNPGIAAKDELQSGQVIKLPSTSAPTAEASESATDFPSDDVVTLQQTACLNSMIAPWGTQFSDLFEVRSLQVVDKLIKEQEREARVMMQMVIQLKKAYGTNDRLFFGKVVPAPSKVEVGEQVTRSFVGIFERYERGWRLRCE